MCQPPCTIFLQEGVPKQIGLHASRLYLLSFGHRLTPEYVLWILSGKRNVVNSGLAFQSVKHSRFEQITRDARYTSAWHQTREAAVVVPLRQHRPALLLLAADVGFGGLTLRIE
jgi:hypothetical protein